MKKLGLFVSITIAAVVLIAQQSGETGSEDRYFQNNHLTDGRELFQLYCAVCHGVDGRGDGPAAEAMKRRPPNLTSISKRNGGDFPTFRITRIIDGYEVKAAHGSREMPVWGEFFHDMQRDETLLKLREHNLVEYIRSLQR